MPRVFGAIAHRPLALPSAWRPCMICTGRPRRQWPRPRPLASCPVVSAANCRPRCAWRAPTRKRIPGRTSRIHPAVPQGRRADRRDDPRGRRRRSAAGSFPAGCEAGSPTDDFVYPSTHRASRSPCSQVVITGTAPRRTGLWLPWEADGDWRRDEPSHLNHLQWPRDGSLCSPMLGGSLGHP